MVQRMGLGKGDIDESYFWENSSNAFSDRFFPQKLREAKVEEFINLKQSRILAKKYALKFTSCLRMLCSLCLI